MQLDCRELPARTVAPQVGGAMQRGFERGRCHREKVQAGRGLGIGSGLLGIDDGVGQSAHPRAERDRTVAHGTKLRQPARLEARRHQHRIGPGLDQMRQILVIADEASDPAAMGVGQASQRYAPVRARRCPAPRAARRRPTSAGSASARRSIPFCQASRLTTPNSSRPGSCARPNRRCSAALLGDRAAAT